MAIYPLQLSSTVEMTLRPTFGAFPLVKVFLGCKCDEACDKPFPGEWIPKQVMFAKLLDSKVVGGNASPKLLRKGRRVQALWNSIWGSMFVFVYPNLDSWNLSKSEVQRPAMFAKVPEGILKWQNPRTSNSSASEPTSQDEGSIEAEYDSCAWVDLFAGRRIDVCNKHISDISLTFNSNSMS